MAKRDPFVDEVLDRLAPLHADARPMFGGYGLYLEGTIFGVIDDGRMYLKVGPATVADFEALGSGPFEYAPGKFLRSYYAVPEEVFAEDHELRTWCKKAALEARTGKAKKKR